MCKNLVLFVLICLITAFQTTINVFSQDVAADQSANKFEGVIKTRDKLPSTYLNLASVLDSAINNNLNIAIKRDLLKQSKLKIDEIKSKRLFLFFKFTNSQALEKSAEYSMKASQEDLKATTNEALYNATSKYYNLLQTLLVQRLTAESLKSGELALNQSEELYNNGKTTRFEVNQTAVFVAGLKQKLMESEMLYMISSVDLAHYINLKASNTNIIPEELKESTDKPVQIVPLSLIPDDLLLGEFVDYAEENRPEIHSLKFQAMSLEELKQTIKNDDIKTETLNSQINQMKNSLDLLKNTIKTTVTQAVLKCIGTKNEMEIGEQKYLISKKAYEQAITMKTEGLITAKNLLDAQVDLIHSKNDYIQTIVNYNTAQINLLKEIGYINTSIIVENKPIDLSNSTELKLDSTTEKTD